MKTISMGNKNSRYALIVMLLNKPNGTSIDDKITFYYSDNLKELRKLEYSLITIHTNYNVYLDMHIYDYQMMKYVVAD